MSDSATDDLKEQLAVLLTAAEQGRTDIVKMVAESKLVSLSAPRQGVVGLPDDGKTALHLAMANGHVDVVRALLKEGCDVSARDDAGNRPVDAADARCQQAVEMELFQRVALGDCAGATELLAAGVPLDCTDGTTAADTPLHWAAAFGNVEVIELLLARGADVNMPNAEGATALHEAASKGQAAAISVLIAHGADVSGKGTAGYSTGRTACQVAEELKQRGAVEALEATAVPGTARADSCGRRGDPDKAHSECAAGGGGGSDGGGGSIRASSSSPPRSPQPARSHPADNACESMHTEEEREELVRSLRATINGMLQDVEVARQLQNARARPLIEKLRNLREENEELRVQLAEMARCNASYREQLQQFGGDAGVDADAGEQKRVAEQRAGLASEGSGEHADLRDGVDLLTQGQPKGGNGNSSLGHCTNHAATGKNMGGTRTGRGEGDGTLGWAAGGRAVTYTYALVPRHAALDGVTFNMAFDGLPRAKCKALVQLAATSLEPSFGDVSVSAKN